MSKQPITRHSISMKITQRQIILNLLRSHPHEWFFSYDLMKVETPWGFIGSQGDRRARELAEDSLIEVNHEEKYARYRAKENKLKEVWRAPDGRIIKQVYEA